MKAYILKRVLSILPVLFIVSIIVFLIIHLTPGDPASVMLGDTASEAEIEKLREELGLNLPVYQQYFHWFFNLFRGDFGHSHFMNQSVLPAILEHLVPTLSLSIMAQLLAIIISIPIGMLAAKYKGTAVDQSFMGLSLIGISIPSFLLGLFLMIIFAVQLQWLPVGGYAPLSDGFWNHIKFLIMPSIALGTMQASLIARMTRASVLETLNTNFIKAVRAKGMKEWKVTFKHALRNSFIPILTVIGQSFGTLVAGAAVTETIFNIPGIGQLILNSVERRDYSVIQGAILFITTMYLLINLFIDLMYGFVDPRVRLERK